MAHVFYFLIVHTGDTIRYLHMTHNPLRWGGGGGVTSRRNVWYHDKN